MPLLFIQAINSEFRSRDEGAEYDRPESALAAGVQSAVVMAADEIARGVRSAAVEVIVEHDDGRQLLRSMVAVSVSPLLLAPDTVTPFPDRSARA